MLIVLEIAPVMKGWAAAIMWRWDGGQDEARALAAALVGAVEDG